MARFFRAGVLAAAVVALATQAQDRVVNVESEDQEMNTAIATAQSTLDGFLKVMAAPPPAATDFTVKVRVAHGQGAEHLWIKPFRLDKSGFVGTVANDPEHLRNLKFGDEISFTRREISDWGYEEQGVKKGFFTVCVMFKHMPPEEVQMYRREHGFAC